MAKVLRLHTEANDNIQDWGKSQPYGADVINQIKDPAGLIAKKEITSIPSPFARIDLTKTAFKAVVDSGDLDGDTIYHKIVSDTLDIGELFFNYNKFADKLDIIVWDKEQELRKLKDSELADHRILGETLQMYLEQDASTYNFDKCDRLYVLNYKGNNRPDARMNIIGATSPSTLFICSANDLSYASDYLKPSGNDRPFDEEYTPLYKRDFAYQRYLYALIESIGAATFAGKFKELYDYLLASEKRLSTSNKDEIAALDANSINNYEVISLSGNQVEVLGFTLYQNNGSDIQTIGQYSDFTIASNIYRGVMPLVLPVKAGNNYSTLRYVNDNWQATCAAPFYDNTAIEKRVLPYTADNYPYLTIGDFLQPSIISMPYELTDAFFNGNINDKKYTFLLPLTDKFFEFFTPDEVMHRMIGRYPMIEMKELAGGSVSVILRIPIKNNRYIEYRRDYLKADECDLDKNIGNVVEKKFGLGVLPLVSFTPEVPAYYRVAFFSKSRNARLLFIDEQKPVQPKNHVIRREASENCSIESYVLEHTFTRISIDVDGIVNTILPKFKKLGNATNYTFAVDFGTTNTHIEYATDNSTSSLPFNILNAEQQMQRMHKDYGMNKDIQYAFVNAFIPDTIGETDDYVFPIRTAFAESKTIDYKQQTDSLANGNIPFRYEKAEIMKEDKIKTNLKWSNSDKEKRRIELYLDNLFFMMRNKVLLNQGNLSATKIIWFYPKSMNKFRVEQFTEIWKSLYTKYFGNNADTNLVRMSESIAPYHYYKQKRGAKSNVVTVDIGGGTTDVYVVENNQPKMLSSFRFAANAIFGDGYNLSADTNGFVKEYMNKIVSILNSNSGMDDVIKALKQIAQTDDSNDIIAVFFSLANNKVVRDKNVPIDFLKMLSSNDKFKYVFIVFYGAILYYVARMMKARQLQLPQTLAFSGNGSKTLGILSSSNETVALFARLIFEDVFDEKYADTTLDVIFDEEPKLATCKGGIAHRSNLTFEESDGLDTSLLGIDDHTFSEGIKYSDIKTEQIKAVAHEVSKFIDFLFDLNSKNKNFFINNLGTDASIIKDIQQICKSDLVEFTKQGLENKSEELKSWGGNDNAEIEETLFFFPIVAMLNNIARQIQEKYCHGN